MKIELSEPNTYKRVLDIEIPAEDVQKEFETKLDLYQKNAQIKGFRAGKVPRQMILSRFSKAIMDETAEELVSRSFENACREKNIVPISRAKIEKVDYAQDKPLKYKAEVEVEPLLELTKYTGLGVKIEDVEIKDKDVDTIIDDLRERLASFDKIERGAKKGDYIRYEYEKVVVDGKERKDYKNPTYPMPIGEAKIKEFDKGLIGAKTGESVNIKFTFPKDFEVADIREKEGDFTVKVTEVLEKKLPELNDDFASKVGPYKTVDELRGKIKEDLEKRKKDEAKTKAVDDLFGKIIEKNEIIIPESQLETYTYNMMEEMKKRTHKPAGPEDQKHYKELGEKEIKRYKITEWVAKKENIKASQEEVDARIKEYADSHNQTFEDLKEQFRKEGHTITLRSDIKEEKTVEWLLEQNKK